MPSSRPRGTRCEHLSAFGHDEAESIDAIKRVIAKLDAARADEQDPRVPA